MEGRGGNGREDGRQPRRREAEIEDKATGTNSIALTGDSGTGKTPN